MTLEGRPVDDWWDGYFSGLAEEAWEALAPADSAREDADFIETALALGPAANVLDLPCGNGRLALELAARGHRLTGQDISPGLIARARRHAARRGVNVEWHVGDMRAPLAVAGGYDAICCWGDSFGYFDDGGNRAHLRAVHAALRAGGRFAVELRMVAELLLADFRPRLAGRAGDISVRVERKYDAQTCRLESRYEFTRAGRTERRHASYRIYTCDELRRLFGACGFESIAMHGKTGCAFGPGADRLRIVAMKPAA
ncbi:MAG: class I SAM-dependent methyltransferase [Rhodocyclaceae bacterium]|nr:class I SAM-dependent methyltransferase [Rhodocyclaceae bacterium]